MVNAGSHFTLFRVFSSITLKKAVTDRTFVRRTLKTEVEVSCASFGRKLSKAISHWPRSLKGLWPATGQLLSITNVESSWASIPEESVPATSAPPLLPLYPMDSGFLFRDWVFFWGGVRVLGFVGFLGRCLKFEIHRGWLGGLGLMWGEGVGKCERCDRRVSRQTLCNPPRHPNPPKSL